MSLYQRAAPRRPLIPDVEQSEGLRVPVGLVDEERLWGRLISVAPSQTQRDPDALVFTRSTKAQERRKAAQKPQQLEILVCIIIHHLSENEITSNGQPLNVYPLRNCFISEFISET